MNRLDDVRRQARDSPCRLTLEQNPWQHKNFGYDAAGRLTYRLWRRLWVNYAYDYVGEMTVVYENGLGASGAALAWYAYDDLGRRTALTRGNGTHTGWYYGAGGTSPWLVSLYQIVTAGAGSVQVDYATNPAGQIVQRTSDNDNYSWTGFVRTSRSYGLNALNQYTSVGGTGQGYDARGNLTYSGSTGYAYTASNRLLWTNASSNGSFYYDAIGRLDIEYGGCNLFDYAGQQMTAELDCNDAHVLRRYVYGAGGEPILWYEGSGTSDRRWLASDERGSVVAVLDGSGNATANSYDEYGVPASSNTGRFQYTGQAWLPSVGMYYYKARIYSPTLGRFLQTDPIGYRDGPNWYNYTGGDPVNNTDPSGLDACLSNGNCQDGWTYYSYGGGECLNCGRNNGTDSGGTVNVSPPVYTGGINATDLTGSYQMPGFPSGGAGGSPLPTGHQPQKTNSQCGRGGQAARLSTAMGYSGRAHDLFGTLADLGGGGKYFAPVSGLLNALSAGSTFVSSLQRGEPVDVAYMRATSPLVTGALGAVGGALGGAAAGGAAGSVVPILGNGVGAIGGGIAGGLAGSVVGEKLGEMSAEEYAKARGYGGC